MNTSASGYGNLLVNIKRTVVNQDSRVEFGAAYGKMWIPENGEIRWIFPDIKRIEVRIDGQIGFVEAEDYMKLGLMPAG